MVCVFGATLALAGPLRPLLRGGQAVARGATSAPSVASPSFSAAFAIRTSPSV